jgi:hypothetical protein
MAKDRLQSRLSQQALHDKITADTLDLITASRELLAREKPDTFLGRETKKPLPKEAEK